MEGTGNRHRAVFQRLAEDFQRAAVELGQFIQKQDAVVGERNLPRHRRVAAADEAGVADGVMGRAERPPGHQRLARLQAAEGAVDAGGFNRFGGKERGQNSGNSFGQHRLAGAGRPDHEQVVLARGGHDDGPLGHLLAPDVAKIVLVLGEGVEQFTDAAGGRFNVELPREEADGLREAGHRNDFNLFHHGCFGRALRGYHQAAQVPLPSRRHRHRERPLRGPRVPFQRQLANHRILLQLFGFKLPAGDEHPERNRQIKRRRALGQFRRGQVNHHPVLRPQIAAVGHRPLHAVLTLLHSRLGEADQKNLGKRPRRDIDLHFHRHRLNPQKRKRLQLGEHGEPWCGSEEAAEGVGYCNTLVGYAASLC